MADEGASAPEVLVEGLSKTFSSGRGSSRRSIHVLDSIGLTVDPGEFVSIIGPTGCGKSTLLNILAGLDGPDSGRVEVGGAGDVLGRSAYMLQDDHLMPWRTVVENAALGLEMKGLSRRQARARARGELAAFGLEGFGDAPPAELSGGMRQRTALMRTFLTGSRVLLLDEPFASLDALTRKAMQQWLLHVWERESKTVLFVTHDVEEALFLSDRVYVLSNRPASAMLRLDVPFARPRDIESVSLSTGLTDLKRQAMAPLREVIRSPEMISRAAE